MTSLFLFTLLFTQTPVAQAGTAALDPHRLHWCAGLFATRPPDSTPVAASPVAINELNARVSQAQSVLSNPDASVVLRKMRGVMHFLTKREGTRIDFSIKDLNERRQVEKNIFEVDALADRLRRIEHAATRLDEDTISFGRVVRGQAEIDAYTAAIATEAARLDADNALGVNQRYKLARRLVLPAIFGSFRAWFAYLSVDMTSQFLTGHHYGLATFGAVLTTVWAESAVTSLREIISYLAGLRWTGARVYHLNQFDPGRQHDFATQLTKVATAVVDGPRPLAHRSISLTTTSDKIDRMLSAAGRSVRPRAPAEADGEETLLPAVDRRTVLIDFVSYRDADDEPILITFVRIVRANLGQKKRTPPRAATRPSAPLGWPGSPEPAGI